MLLLMLTAQEGRLPTDTSALLNTGRARLRKAAAQYLCALAGRNRALPGVKTGETAAVLNRR